DLTLPASGGSISLRGISGDALVEPPFRAVAKRTWRIGPGTEGGPSVAVKTVSGDLRARGTLATDANRLVESAVVPVPTPPEPPPAPAPPVPPADTGGAPADPRLAVLQAVERGEIDIDEAMRRLDGLA